MSKRDEFLTPYEVWSVSRDWERMADYLEQRNTESHERVF